MTTMTAYRLMGRGQPAEFVEVPSRGRGRGRVAGRGDLRSRAVVMPNG